MALPMRLYKICWILFSSAKTNLVFFSILLISSIGLSFTNGWQTVKTTFVISWMLIGFVLITNSSFCNIEKSKISFTKFDSLLPLLIIIHKCDFTFSDTRSEERRVGKEGRYRR